jgi:hypothetical protein
LIVSVTDPVPTSVMSRVTVRFLKPAVGMSGLVWVVVRLPEGSQMLLAANFASWLIGILRRFEPSSAR